MIKIYGKNLVNSAIENNAPLEKIFVYQDNYNLIKQLDYKKLSYQKVSKQELDKLFGPNHQGIGAYRADYKTYDLNYFLDNSLKDRILILDGIQDPHNFGAIIRSVDAFGFKGIILGNNRSVPITPTVAHVSTGAIEYVKICYVNSLSNAVKELKKNNYWIICAEAFGTDDIDKIDLNRNIALVIGSEGFGITRTILKEADYTTSINMKGHVNSLNASVSAGILMEKLK